MLRYGSIAIVTLAAVAALASACGSRIGGQTASAQARRLPLRGVVVSLDGDRVTVSHDAIPGYMDAMTMSFALRDRNAAAHADAGALIAATLVVEGDRSWLDDVAVESRPTDAATIRRSLTGAAGAKAGDELPDFALTDQNGRAMSTRDYRGTALAITFIYTRCPLPDFCPFVSKNFAATVRELQRRPDLAARVRLLSVTIDPEHDAPDVLRAYRASYAGGDSPEAGVWQLATGSADQVSAIAGFFGLRTWREDGQIVHALRTAVVDVRGRITRVDAGNAWKPAGLIAELERAAR
jgi:protein SCO1/2